MNREEQDIPTVNRLTRLLLSSYQAPVTGDLRTDVLPVYREAAYRFVSLAVGLLLPYIAVLYGYYQNYLLVLLYGISSTLVLVHCWQLLVKNIRILSPEILLILVVSLMASAIATGEPEAVYWSYTVIVSFYLMLERRLAQWVSLIWLLSMGVLSYYTFSLPESVAFMTSLAVTGFCTQVFSSVVYRQELGLRQLAVIDPLTHAYNRRSMMDELEQALALFERYDTPSTLVMIDIDHFKRVNDDFGHEEGDRVLIALVALLQQRLRRTDRFCRYGGEEFVAILNEIELPQAIQLAESFCQQVRETQLTERCRITISCGVAQVQRGDTLLEWLHRSDMALYRAKTSGRDRVVADSLPEIEVAGSE